MNSVFTLSLGGVGFFGRFVLAAAILMLLKSFDKNNKELDKGLKKLIFFGVIAIVLMSIAFFVFLFLFRLPFTISNGYFYH